MSDLLNFTIDHTELLLIQLKDMAEFSKIYTKKVFKIVPELFSIQTLMIEIKTLLSFIAKKKNNEINIIANLPSNKA